MFTICPKMVNTDFISQNLDPARVVKLDVLLKVFNPEDQSQMLRYQIQPYAAVDDRRADENDPHRTVT